ncbi:cytochrome P450 [Actinomycetospora straminea]|nr:cytochrome P450 [Actinomycetospora straminea]MDD7933587.1 cytochrome P450 [Actinomycetospora straminea]
MSDETAGYWAPWCPAGAHDDAEHLREHFDPLSESLTRGRYVRIAGEMARQCPVTRTDGFGEGIWTVSGYAELQELHRQEDSAFSAFPVLLQHFGNTRPMIPMESDPPLHRQYKQIIAPLLSRSVQTDKEPAYRAIARDLIARFVDRGRCEVFGELCNPMTAHALMDALGVPGPDRERLADLAVALVRGRAEGGNQAEAIYAYFTDLAAAKRREPGDDLVTALTTATVDGRPLTEEEILDYCVILLPAGFETTASSMSFVLLLLAEHPSSRTSCAAPPSASPTPSRSSCASRRRRARTRGPCSPRPRSAGTGCAPASASTSTGRAPTTTRGPSTVPRTSTSTAGPTGTWPTASGRTCAWGCTWRAPS